MEDDPEREVANWKRRGKPDVLEKYGIRKENKLERKVSGPSFEIAGSDERYVRSRNMVSLEGPQNFPGMEQSIEKGGFLSGYIVRGEWVIWVKQIKVNLMEIYSKNMELLLYGSKGNSY